MKQMPKCFDCGKEQPVLKSFVKPTDIKDMFGKALCDDCFADAVAQTKKGGK